MKRTLIALTLAGTLTCAAVANAGPRARPTPPAAPLLTYEEQLCEALGRFTLAQASERNAGVSLFTALALSRQWDRRHGVSAEVQAIHDHIIRGVYAAWTLTPALLQQLTEAACAQELERPPSTPMTDKYRY